MQIGKAARSNGSHIKSRLKMEPHGVFKEAAKQCTNKDYYQSGFGEGVALADWFKACVARQRAGPTSLGIAPARVYDSE